MIHEYVTYLYLSEPMILLVLLSPLMSGAHVTWGSCLYAVTVLEGSKEIALMGHGFQKLTFFFQVVHIIASWRVT